MTTVFLLLGSNLGDRPATLRRAVDLLQTQVGNVKKTSGLYETAPWGNTDQPAFLNQAVELSTELPPLELLKTTQSIEEALGRVRREKWGARVIDIDLLFFGTEILDFSDLKIPHPYLPERRFALAPLAELAPEFVHPGLRKTVSALLAECVDGSEVKRIGMLSR
ncbi:MAG: 2-amino-4-hydroxy-6-hydroxymethyldihydropteridine diphosphokinase [Sphingobacteriaceae bacterium]|nr:2-amino-4-hydroxy-6-hydroxymethyldihydropteridine diphosphokinase [Cytophagaceae bacterium]